MAGDDSAAGGERDERGHHADERAFARAVGAEETEDFALGNRKADVLDGFKVAITLDDVLDGDGRRPWAAFACFGRDDVGIPSLLHQLVFGNVDFGGHAGDEALAGIVDEQLQLDGFDVALASADVALGGEVGLGGFVDDFALDCCARGHDDMQRVAELDGVGLRFRQRRIDPGLGQIHDGDNGRSGGDHFALSRGANVDLAADRRKDLRVTQLHLRLLSQCTEAFDP